MVSEKSPPVLNFVARPTDSGHIDTVCLNGTPFEHRCAGEAAKAVELFYKDLGLLPSVREKLVVEFCDQIRPDGKNVDWVIGLYHREQRRVYICPQDSPILRNNPRFAGLDTEEIYRSILAHEIAHHFNHCLCPGLFPPVDEAIAGFVQYSLMDPELRKKMLNRVGATSFGTVRDITMAAYINSPDGFLGASYLYLHAHPTMVKRILRGRAPLPRDPMFVEFPR